MAAEFGTLNVKLDDGFLSDTTGGTWHTGFEAIVLTPVDNAGVRRAEVTDAPAGALFVDGGNHSGMPGDVLTLTDAAPDNVIYEVEVEKIQLISAVSSRRSTTRMLKPPLIPR